MSGTKRASSHEEEDERKRRKEDIASDVLHNPDILVNVFKFLDLTRLKLCRTVCKTWSEEIFRELKNRSVSYVHERDYPRFVKVVESGGKQDSPLLVRNLALQIKDHFNLAELPPVPLPITKLHLKGSSVRMDSTKGALLSLLRHGAPTLTSLKIPLCRIMREEEKDKSKELEFPLLEELFLTMDDWTFDSPVFPLEDSAVAQDQDVAVSFFSKLIESSPKLRRLEITSEAGPIAKIMTTFKLEKLSSLSIWVAHDGDAGIVSAALKRIKFRNLESLSLTSGGFENCFNPLDIRDIVKRNTSSLESLSLDVLVSLPSCPKLKHLTVKNFTVTCLNLSSFPALSSIRIRKLLDHLPNPLPEGTYCPSSLRRVEIVREQKSCHIRNIYRFFSGSVTDWEVPEGNVEEFCDTFVLNHENGIRRLAISSNCYHFPKYCHADFAKTLEKVGNLRDLEELTINSRLVELHPEFWEAFNPEVLPNNLKTFSFYNYTNLGELKKYADKLQLIRNVVLLHHHPVPLGKEAEEFFIAVPNATARYRAEILRDVHHQQHDSAEEINEEHLYNTLHLE